MKQHELRTFAHLGSALWADPSRSRGIALETMAAATLLDVAEEARLDRAARALLERAFREGMAGNTQANLMVAGTEANRFFRLPLESRFVLAALHGGRWSYARLARILEETPEQIEERAWTARVELAVIYPAGAKARTSSCPEYIPHRPWTQRFLDEEIGSTRERLFLQNHLMACDSCREALNRCRNLYYSIEAMLPGAQGGAEQVQLELERICGTGRSLQNRIYVTFEQSLTPFLRRSDIRAALAIGAGLLLWKLRSG